MRLLAILSINYDGRDVHTYMNIFFNYLLTSLLLLDYFYRLFFLLIIKLD